MPRKIVALSGRIGTGKSTLCQRLVERYGALVFRTRDEIDRRTPANDVSRRSLQQRGDDLDRDTQGEWVVEGIKRQLERDNISDDALVVVDSVRIAAQIEALQRALGARRHPRSPNRAARHCARAVRAPRAQGAGAR